MDLTHEDKGRAGNQLLYDHSATGATGPALGLASVDSLLAGLWS